ncbi:PDZ domain-containing protein [Thalassoroseus pseudoceratinae]|uniref:PDZ domain-containing protein n=1 Tax=Thalassoroseus pseudoceratinae TaxID=2713176 RepID=UPI00141E2223|nr:PDZ domain-containing protein [Thalassoroseus pseudoceratinae]
MIRFVLNTVVFSSCFLVNTTPVSKLWADPPPVVAEKSDRPSLTERQIETLIQDLSSPKFARRQAATKTLATGGANVVDPVLKAAKTHELEVATRAVQILEFLFLYGIPETSMEAQVALEELADRTKRFHSGTVIQKEANDVLALNYHLREERALAAIRRLGGIVRYREGLDGNLQNVTRNQPPEIVILTLQKWKGKSEDLQYIKRLDRLQQLYVIRKEVGDMEYVNAISEDDVAEIQKALPQVDVSWRGPAFLGVSGVALPGRGCELSTVSPNQAAAKAGLRKNDLLLKFDGQDVDNFEQLVRLIGRHDPGDKIAATALRNNQLLEFEITLEGWK